MKLRNLLITGILIFVSRSVFAEAILFSDDFKNYTGGAPAGWSSTNSAQMTAQNTIEFGAGLKMTTTASITDVNITKVFSKALTGKIEVDFSVFPYSTAHKRPMLYFKDTSGNESFFLLFNNNGTILRYKNSNSASDVLTSYSKDTWYHIKAVIDTDNTEYSLSINGYDYGTFDYSNKTLTDFKSFKLSQWDKDGSCIVDNVKIAAIADKYETLRLKKVLSITGGEGYDSNDSDIASYISSVNTNGKNYQNSMIKSPSSYLWNDAKDFTKSATISTNFDRLNKMALAYSTKGCALFGNTSLKNDIITGLTWLYNNKYNKNIPEYDNWWEWDIGTPLQLTDIITLMYNELDPALIAGYLEALDYYVPSVPTTDAGANRAWRSYVIMMRGILGKNDAKIQQSVSSLLPVFENVTEDDGFYDDGSYIQHDYLSYTMGYGKSLLESVTKTINLLSESEYKIPDEDLDTIYGWIFNSFEPLMYKGAGMSMTSGREIARNYSDHIIGHKVIAAALMLYPYAPAEYKFHLGTFLKEMITSDTSKSFTSGQPIIYIELAKALINDSSIPRRQNYTIYKQFAKMDRMVTHKKNFAFGVSMSSNRIYNYESINGENIKGWYTGDGMTYLYNNHLTHYGDNYWNTVNMYRLPGTTVETKTRTDGEQAGKKTAKSFVGGASLGEYGVTGMEIAPVGLSLTGKKSWFVFDDEVVCLGSDITSTAQNNIETIIENRMLNSTGSNDLYIDGVKTGTSLGAEALYQNPKWMNLYGQNSSNIGYYFPENVVLGVLREARAGSWSQVNSGGSASTVTRRYLNIVKNHGTAPINESYSYVLLPEKTNSQMNNYTNNPDIAIVSNTSDVHCVYEKNLLITAANFWNDNKSVSGISVTKKSSVIMKEEEGGLQIGVSDPTQLSNSVIIVIDKPGIWEVESKDENIEIIHLKGKIEFRVNNLADGKTYNISLKKAYGKMYLTNTSGGTEYDIEMLTNAVVVAETPVLEGRVYILIRNGSDFYRIITKNIESKITEINIPLPLNKENLEIKGFIWNDNFSPMFEMSDLY